MSRENIFNKINETLKDKPLIYFSREVERAIGLETVLKNYHICCVEDSYIVDQLIKKGYSVFCLEREEKDLDNKSTISLLSSEKTIEWVKKITGNKEFFALTFLPSSVVNFKIQKLGGILLNNPYELNQKFENKLSFAALLETYRISRPKNKNLFISEVDYDSLKTEFGEEMVAQIEKSHTGNGTFFIKSKAEFEEIKNKFLGNKIKFSEKIEGTPLTINCAIYKEKIYIGPMQYQITGIPGVTGTEGVTIGNDFSYGFELIKNAGEVGMQNLLTEISKIGQLLLNEKYRGLFGIDFILKEDKFYIIEINARQTANIPFQSKLELMQNNQIPLAILHLCEFLKIEIGLEDTYQGIPQINGSQIFIRSLEDNFIIKKEYKSGVYRLQSDNSAMDWGKEDPEVNKDVIFLDEDKDKPLIFQTDGYSIDEVEAGFLLISQKVNTEKNRLDEIIRFQFKEGIVMEGKIKPWVLEMYKKLSA